MRFRPALTHWLLQRPAWVPLWAAALGALHSLSFAPFAVWPLGPLCLAALWLLWRGLPARRAAWVGFAFSAGLFLSGTYWLYTSIHVLGKAPVALALILMLGLVALMGSYTAVLAALLARRERDDRLSHLLWVLPGSWVLMEWFRGWFLSGFPWLAVGYGQIDTPLVGYAPVFGIYGVSLLTAMTAGAVVALFVLPGWRRLAPACLMVLLWGVGAGLSHVPWTQPSAPPVSVALVQGAISQDLKWQEDNRDASLSVYQRLTAEAYGARLIVWPESTLPELYQDAVPYLTGIYRDAHARGSDLLLGLIRYDVQNGELRNGLVALSDRELWYDKRRLVPFGEFFPVPAFIREWMRLKNMGFVDFSPGPARQPPLEAGGQRLAATICYEDAYAVEQLDELGSATLLVNVSNDAWFGDSTAPHQHLQITRMRAIEAGRWLMRATNNGISALIDPSGRVVRRSHQFVPEVLRGEVVPYHGQTPYARLKNWPVLLWCTAGIAWIFLRRLRWRRAIGES